MHSVHSPPNDIEGSPEPLPILPTLQITLLSKNEDPPTGETCKETSPQDAKEVGLFLARAGGAAAELARRLRPAPLLNFKCGFNT